MLEKPKKKKQVSGQMEWKTFKMLIEDEDREVSIKLGKWIIIV